MNAREHNAFPNGRWGSRPTPAPTPAPAKQYYKTRIQLDIEGPDAGVIAIAAAVVEKAMDEATNELLAKRKVPSTLFSTHTHAVIPAGTPYPKLGKD